MPCPHHDTWHAFCTARSCSALASGDVHETHRSRRADAGADYRLDLTGFKYASPRRVNFAAPFASFTLARRGGDSRRNQLFSLSE